MATEMPFQIGWYLENSVLYAHLDRQLQGDEASHFNQAMIEAIRSGEPPVFLIMDLRDVVMSSTPKVANLRRVGTYRAEDNLRWMLTVIDSDKVLDFVVSAVTQVAGTSYNSFDNLAEAIEFAQKRLPNANWETVKKSILQP